MEKNYYEILEVNKNASQEIIEKAYKTLIKKYHPDLQPPELKPKYEEKIKLINEAFEVLSNEQKRKEFDLTLSSNEISVEDYNNLYNENLNLKRVVNELKQYHSNNNPNQYNTTEAQNFSYQNTANNYRNTTFTGNPINEFSNYYANVRRNVKHSYKYQLQKKFKDFLALIITIALIFVISFILWHIPFVKNYIINSDIYMLFNGSF